MRDLHVRKRRSQLLQRRRRARALRRPLLARSQQGVYDLNAILPQRPIQRVEQRAQAGIAAGLGGGMDFAGARCGDIILQPPVVGEARHGFGMKGVHPLLAQGSNQRLGQILVAPHSAVDDPAPAFATPEKGRLLADRAVAGVSELVGEMLSA